MASYGRINKKMYPTRNPEWPISYVQEGSQKAVSGLRLGVWDNETCPERSGVPNCINYMRTGCCVYGAKCNFNHPKDRNSFVGDDSLGRGEYPERVGEQECKFYLRTGTCYFGMRCRFHHPRNLLTEVPLNFHGYPLRPGEKECSYYMQTGLCKFGMACKFHHPQPSDNISVPPPSVYLVQSPSTQISDPFGAVFTNYKPPRPPPSLLVNPYVHPPIVSLANWNAYQGVINHPLSLRAKPGVEAMVPPAFQTTYHLPFDSSGSSYMKQQKLPKMFCFLSPLGLPLRQGVQPCKFYLQNGSCKFGQNCRYDHPMGAMQQYNPSSSTTTAG